MPFVHDELVIAVNPRNTNLLQDAKDYFKRVIDSSLLVFESEVTAYLSTNAKFSDVLLRFPEGSLTENAAAVSFTAGQSIQQIYRLNSITQYGQFKPDGLLFYTKGNYHLRVSVRMDYQSIYKGEPIYTEEFEALANDTEYLDCIEIDLSGSEFIKAINSKKQDKVVIEVSFLSDCELYPQSFIEFSPGVGTASNAFDMNGFAQGFSDGFSISLGLKLPDTKPLISLVGTTINFDVDAFISKNADRLKFCFANRIASRLLSDKLSGANLNIFTNTEREITALQIDKTEQVLKQHFKMVANALLFDVQSSSTPPMELKGKVGYEMGGYLGYDYAGLGSDEGAYPTTGLNL